MAEKTVKVPTLEDEIAEVKQELWRQVPVLKMLTEVVYGIIENNFGKVELLEGVGASLESATQKIDEASDRLEGLANKAGKLTRMLA